MGEHALLSQHYLNRVANSVKASANGSPQLRVVIADAVAVEEIPFEEVTIGDVIRHAGEDCTVIDINYGAGRMVVIDPLDHAEAIHDCEGHTFTRCEIGF